VRVRMVLFLGALSFLLPNPAQGARYDAGLSLIVDLPQEEFANISGTGGGLGFKLLLPLRSSMVRFRGDLDLLFFGEDEHYGDVHGWEGVIVTRHESIRLLAGLELSSPPSRSVRIYLAPVAGLYAFRSIDRIQYTYFHETSSSQAKFGWKIDAGIVVRRFVRPYRPEGLGLDFGVSYGTVRRGVETKIEPAEGGDAIKIHTDANEIMIHAGIIWHSR